MFVKPDQFVHIIRQHGIESVLNSLVSALDHLKREAYNDDLEPEAIRFNEFMEALQLISFDVDKFWNKEMFGK